MRIMRITIFVLMAIALVGCGRAPAVQPTEAPAATPVPVEPTAAALQPEPTQAPTQESAAPSAPTAGVVFPASLNGDFFTDMSASTNTFSLNCEPKEIKFDVNVTDASITQVDMYYRVRDRQADELPPEFKWGKTLDTDGTAHFWTTVKGDDIPADLRKADTWYEIQFIGINKGRDVVGRSERILELITYTKDCPSGVTLPSTQESAAPSGPATPVEFPASLNGDFFTDMSASTNTFSLNCEPKEIKFDVNVTDASITQVDMYYRVRDRQADELLPEFKWGKTLDTDGTAHFWTTVKGDDIPADLRKADTWYEIQFIGINKGRDVVGRSERILELITYTKDCP